METLHEQLLETIPCRPDQAAPVGNKSFSDLLVEIGTQTRKKNNLLKRHDGPKEKARSFGQCQTIVPAKKGRDIGGVQFK
jgi:hypothetical protein